MKIGNVLCFGIWDSETAHLGRGKTEDRTLRCYEIELMITGGGSVSLNGAACHLVPDLLIVAKPGQQKHTVFPYKTYFLHLEPEKDFPYIEILENAPDFFYTIDADIYTDLFVKMIAYLADHEKDTDSLAFNALFLSLLAQMQQDFARNQQSGMKKRGREKFRQAAVYLENHYAERITLRDLSMQAHYSPTYFQRLFRSFTGTSPLEYLQKLRLNRAKHLLLNTDQSIAEIAEACGFPSQAYFSKIFKKAALITPTEYRKNATESYLPESGTQRSGSISLSSETV